MASTVETLLALETGQPANDLHHGLALEPRATGEHVHAGVGHERGDVLGFLHLGRGVTFPDDERRRRVHAREDVPYVGLPQDLRQRLGDVGAHGVPGDARVAPHELLIHRERVPFAVRDAGALGGAGQG